MNNRKIKTPNGTEYRAKRWGAGGLTQIQEKIGSRWFPTASVAVYPERANAILDRLAAGDKFNAAFENTRDQ